MVFDSTLLVLDSPIRGVGRGLLLKGNLGYFVLPLASAFRWIRLGRGRWSLLPLTFSLRQWRLVFLETFAGWDDLVEWTI